MGYLVDGYCHETIAEARVHFNDVLFTPNSNGFAQASVLNFYVPANPSGGSPGAGQVRYRLDHKNTATDYNLDLPTCDSSYEGGPMPWGVVSSQVSGIWDGPYSLEFVGALIAAAWAVWGLAFLARTSFRIFR